MKDEYDKKLKKLLSDIKDIEHDKIVAKDVLRPLRKMIYFEKRRKHYLKKIPVFMQNQLNKNEFFSLLSGSVAHVLERAIEMIKVEEKKRWSISADKFDKAKLLKDEEGLITLLKWEENLIYDVERRTRESFEHASSILKNNDNKYLYKMVKIMNEQVRLLEKAVKKIKGEEKEEKQHLKEIEK